MIDKEKYMKRYRKKCDDFLLFIHNLEEDEQEEYNHQLKIKENYVEMLLENIFIEKIKKFENMTVIIEELLSQKKIINEELVIKQKYLDEIKHKIEMKSNVKECKSLRLIEAENTLHNAHMKYVTNHCIVDYLEFKLNPKDKAFLLNNDKIYFATEQNKDDDHNNREEKDACFLTESRIIHAGRNKQMQTTLTLPNRNSSNYSKYYIMFRSQRGDI